MIRIVQKNLFFAPEYYFVSVLIGIMVYLVCKKIIGNTKSIVIGTIVIYLFLILSSAVFIRTPKEQYNYELMLFWSYKEIFKGNLILLFENILNVLMLMPVGVLLAIGFDIRKKYVIITGVMISLTIEVLQLVTRRGLFEFDDMLHNSIGCLIGYVVCRWMRENMNELR